MIKLSEQQIQDYLKRSYLTVDGLWFVKTEEKHDFEAALYMDNEVWKVMSKIQAHLLKQMGGLADGLPGLAEALETKMTLDGHPVEIKWQGESGFEIIVKKCPWHELRVKSGRINISPRIGEVICGTNMTAIAAEFNKDIKVERPFRICSGDAACRFRFSINA
ncbi:MAG: DUF6125 family protein [Dehalococcoidales bacterium]|nr:DUF6125 family protein [Dehalococcoidales bacterium]